MDPPGLHRRVDALGAVVEAERGALPYLLVHGEPLVACAAWALGESGAALVDVGTDWSAVVAADLPLVLHDALCPMTPATFLAECVRLCVDTDRVVVGVRPVTDTVKVVEDGYVGATLDRDGLVEVASPVVLPASVVRLLDRTLDLSFPRLVSSLAERFPVETVTAPPDARRVRDADDVTVLEALTARQGG